MTTTVTAEDQLLINKFARTFNKHLLLAAEIKEAQSTVTSISEAGDEILLLDDDDANSIPLRIGQTFVHFNSDSLNDRLEVMKVDAEKDLEEKKAKNAELLAEMDRLKKILYGKFGDKINLESEAADV